MNAFNVSPSSTSDSVFVRVWNRVLVDLGKVQQAWVLVVVFLASIAVVTYLVGRIHATYTVQHDLALLKLDNRTHETEVAAFQQSCTERLDVLEQVLFGDVVPKQATTNTATAGPRLSRIELYQQNTNKELRTRLDRLERWRLAMER